MTGEKRFCFEERKKIEMAKIRRISVIIRPASRKSIRFFEKRRRQIKNGQKHGPRYSYFFSFFCRSAAIDNRRSELMNRKRITIMTIIV